MLIGDDIKSQVGATILHRVLAKLMLNRGIEIDKPINSMLVVTLILKT